MSAWRSAVPSFLLLIGTFYFINSACLRESRNEPPPPPPPCHGARTDAPSGASVRFVTPTPDQVFSRSDRPLVPVRIELAAEGIAIEPQYLCVDGAGFFHVNVRHLGGPCVPQQTTETIFLREGESQTSLELPAGRYAIDVSVVASSGFSFEPPIQASTAISVEAPTGVPDGGTCP